MRPVTTVHSWQHPPPCTVQQPLKGLSPLRARVCSKRKAPLLRVQTTSRDTITPPYNVLVTGSSKGVGRALAEDFLKAGDNVVLCARNGDQLESTLRELTKQYGEQRVKGIPCNVAKAEEVRALADFAAAEYGSVDIWINNAGSNAYKYGPLLDAGDDDLRAIVETNVLGVMLCCKTAIQLMSGQPAGGHIFNMDGAGADGNATPRFAAYGATKRSLEQLGKSLAAELKMAGQTKIGLHNLSPGMVTTELLMSGADTPTAKFFINALAEPPEVVAEYLVPRIRQVPLEPGSSAYIRYLTKPKAFSQIITRLLTGARRNRFVPED